MKYANYCKSVSNSINIGDYIQFFALSFLYEQMGISDRDICYIGLNDVVNYDGDEIVLPINFSIQHFVKDGRIAIPPQVTPVFLAVRLTTVSRHIDPDVFLNDEHNRNYFIRYSPIGCRDEMTYNYFEKYGIPAYINGCLTAVFPKSHELSGKNIVFADAPRNLLQWIPENLLNSEIVFTTQQYSFSEHEIKDYRKIFDFVRSKYDFYKKNAQLIVTSRLHVALPCTAFGIPVVLAKDSVDERFSFIEKYIPIYDNEHYREINWSPEVPDIEPLKNYLTNLAISRIKTVMETAKNGNTLTSMFQARKKQEKYKDSHMITHRNGDRFEEYASKYWTPKGNKVIKYGLWGANAINAEYWKHLIETKYPNAKLSAMYDRYRKDELFGIPFVTPDALADLPDVCVIVCGISATADALRLFKRLGITEERYAIVSDCFISQDDISDKKG